MANTFDSEEYRKEQMEALEALVSYSEKLLKGMETVAGELAGDKLEDTDEFLRKVIDGINWVLQVFNACLPLINENEELVNKDKANDVIKEYDAAAKSGNDLQKSEVISEKLIPLIKLISEASKKTIA